MRAASLAAVRRATLARDAATVVRAAATKRRISALHAGHARPDRAGEWNGSAPVVADEVLRVCRNAQIHEQMQTRQKA